MPEPTPLAKAELRQLNAKFTEEIERGTWTQVQFNPETLKVSFANQVPTPSGTGDQRGTPGRQYVGAGTTKLAVQLWFDVTHPEHVDAKLDDVRKLTQKVAFFITPKKVGEDFIPPAVRFLWGTFEFDGVMESLEESLEFFSPEGKPLRASVSFTLTQQKVTVFSFRAVKGTPGSARTPSGMPPGTVPMVQASAGATLQGLASAEGDGADWRAIASANGIENPRLLQPGRLLDLKAGVGLGTGAQAGFTFNEG
ncbi:peptidoglycan-binding protein [Corallococcus sp. AB045]|uniref:CIS tube protein n=1 Tax=Corallococcus sp. AB045 TaxID=2316719 RepID=UPI000EB9A6DF|nr:peptidoglycan-binding protein [Corallococcus sp. AB045]RKH77980.1 peptidoglycan-binding protein [Corallococcus sp. AB045]